LAALVDEHVAGWVTQGAEYAMRSAALPYLLGVRWYHRREHTTATSLLVAAKMAVDELFFCTEVLAGAPFALLESARIGTEIDGALALFKARGWLDDPASYHATPPPLDTPDLTAAVAGNLAYLHLQAPSRYEPARGEPGSARWATYAANQTAHAWLLRHPGPPRPWIVCLPGYRMGAPLVDFAGFRAGHLHRRLGLNVAVPVMPFHGPRGVGRRGGDGFLSGDFLDTIHAQTQAVWDARRLIRWLRSEGAPAVGIYGLSLGGYTTALLAALEPDLACVIAGIPAIDFLDLVLTNTSPALVALADRVGFPLEPIRTALRVISPLAMPRRVPHERCFIFAGAADTLAQPHQAAWLWEHWERPRMCWYPGGHVSYLLEPTVTELLDEALRTGGLVAEG
jgi:hypothetical protein